MADEVEVLEDERATELSVISAIYPELQIDSSDPFSASIDIRVEPLKPLPVIFLPVVNEVLQSGLVTPPNSDEQSDVQPAVHELREALVIAESEGQEIHHLANLPALTLKIHLQHGYPMQKPPIFDLRSKSPWLPETKLQELAATGLSIWEDMGRDQVVFAYIDHLRDAAEHGFNLLQNNQTCIEMPQSLQIALLDFDLQAKRTKFEEETFECGVCLEPKKGLLCHRLLLCSHVFCVECLQDYFSNCIVEGAVLNVKCMALKCGSASNPNSANENDLRKTRRRKKDRTLDPSELLQIPLDQETVQKYVRLKRKQKLESDPNTIYCPRQWCQGPARSKKSESASQDLDPDSDSDIAAPQSYDPNANDDTLPPRRERLAICEDCSFAFCKVCKTTWHGEFSTCFPRKQSELTAEEKASEDYIKKHTSHCPTCNATSQKTMGCNHMVCSKCQSHFCNLCCSRLDEVNPYMHFNTPRRPCYMRLWENEGGTDGAPMMNAHHHPIPEDDINHAPAINNDIQQAPPPPPPPPAPPPAPVFFGPPGPPVGRYHRPDLMLPRYRRPRLAFDINRWPWGPMEPVRPLPEGFAELVGSDDEEDDWYWEADWGGIEDFGR